MQDSGSFASLPDSFGALFGLLANSSQQAVREACREQMHQVWAGRGDGARVKCSNRCEGVGGEGQGSHAPCVGG